MNNKLVKEFLRSKAGPNAYPIAKALNGGKTDKEVSEEVGIDVNKVRTILNRLHYIGVVRYDKEKAKRSNWYTYTWFLRADRVNELLEKTYGEELEELEKELDLKRNHVFFKCNNGCEALPFELAYEYNFQCPNCSEEMNKSEEGNTQEIEERIDEITKLLG